VTAGKRTCHSHNGPNEPLVSCWAACRSFRSAGTWLMQSYCFCTCADFLESMDPSVRIKLRSMFDDGLVGRWLAAATLDKQHTYAAQHSSTDRAAAEAV
jgi:hypothetical protein